MKSKLSFIQGAAACLTMIVSICTAESRDVSKDEPGTPEPAQAGHPERLNRIVKASDVLGTEVKNLRDESLGKVKDFVVDVEGGRILQVFVSSGSVLGVGDGLVAVPPSALVCQVPHPTLRLDATHEKFAGAPEVEVSRWREATQPDRVIHDYQYFGKQPYFATGQTNIGLKSALQPRIGSVQMASQIIGAIVKNESQEKLGKIDDLMVDVEGGRLVHLIVSSGGFLGIGDDLRAVPPAVFRYLPEGNILVINTSKDILSGSPRFKAYEWPDFGDNAYSASIYRAYGVEPYFNLEADNTDRNKRDQGGPTLTPLDQGSSASDFEMTRKIRKELLDQQNLSFDARNIKVITLRGRVTLRGPVNSEAEKNAIEETVRRVAPSAEIDNHLEVEQPVEK